MAYASSVASLNKILDAGIAAQPSSGAAITQGGAIYRYCSSHGATDIVAAGFFTGCGAQVRHSSGPAPFELITRSPNNVGARPGDVVINIGSSAASSPGRVTMHAITASSYGSSGFDCTVSAHAST